MRLFIIFIFSLINLTLSAQTSKLTSTKRSNPGFPKNFVGIWKGTMTWYPNGRPIMDSIAVQLHIQPVKDSVNQYTWKIIYGDKQQDVRPYVLRKVDTVKNHWVVDEGDGLILDSYWLGNRLSGAFSVDGNTILDSYWIENGNLNFEFFGFPKQPMKTVKQNEEKATAEEPAVTVDTYKITSYQRGVLKKVKTN